MTNKNIKIKRMVEFYVNINADYQSAENTVKLKIQDWKDSEVKVEQVYQIFMDKNSSIDIKGAKISTDEHTQLFIYVKDGELIFESKKV